MKSSLPAAVPDHDARLLSQVLDSYSHDGSKRKFNGERVAAASAFVRRVNSSARSRQRLMFNSIGQDDEARSAGESLQISALLGFAALLVPDAGEAGARRGTVDATVEAVERSFYGKRSETLINGMPVSSEHEEPATG